MSKMNKTSKTPVTNNEDTKISGVRLLCLGNSLQYFNHCPTVLQEMLEASDLKVSKKLCLRGGSDFTVLYKKGTSWLRRQTYIDYGCATLQELFDVDDDDDNHNADLEVCIMNDYTQTPGRPEERQASIEILKEKYIPLFRKYQDQRSKAEASSVAGNQSNFLCILLETPAYGKEGWYRTGDLGTFDEFTKSVQEGYRAYRDCLTGGLTTEAASICPWGTAYAHLHDTNPELFQKLYIWDYRHPSPHGTLLLAYLLYMKIADQVQLLGIKDVSLEPPTYNSEWFLPHSTEDGLVCRGYGAPSEQDARALLLVAQQVYRSQKDSQQ